MIKKVLSDVLLVAAFIILCGIAIHTMRAQKEAARAAVRANTSTLVVQEIHEYESAYGFRDQLVKLCDTETGQFVYMDWRTGKIAVSHRGNCR